MDPSKIEKTPAESTINTVLDQSSSELYQLKEESLRKPENEKLKERIDELMEMTEKLKSELYRLREDALLKARGSESMEATKLTEENVTRKPDQPRHVDSQSFVHYGEQPDPHDTDPDHWTR